MVLNPVQIQPIDFLEGTLIASPSKSYSHRAFAMALMANSRSMLINPLVEGDVAVTIDFCRKLGAKIQQIQSDRFPAPNIVLEIIPPQNRQAPNEAINGKNSGTSIRILTALSAVFPGITRIYGTFFDRKRPLTPLLDALSQIGMKYQNLDDPLGVELNPLNIRAGEMTIPGDISSQFITGLMTLAPHLPQSPTHKETIIRLSTPAKSFPYLQISEEVLRDFGVKIQSNFSDSLVGSYTIPAGQSYPGRDYIVPCDFSSAAFILVAAALNPFPKTVTLQNLDMSNPQGDKQIISILQKAGANLTIDPSNREIQITGASFLSGQSIDMGQIPDLFPILCVLGVYSENVTRLYNARHVRIKETDRIMVMVRELRKMGAIIQEKEDEVIIEGPQQLHGTEIVHDEDHRIAMALSIAALFARSPSTINNPDVVHDSYPNFFSDLKKLGVRFQE
jgi:3-phosphoshikimate 1-carboxyvinyltransferase